MFDFPTDLTNFISEISSKGISSIGGHWLSANNYENCSSHFTNFQDQLYTYWDEDLRAEVFQIKDFNEIFQNTNEDNFDFGCEELGFSYLFNLLNSQNTTTLRNTMLAQVQGTGISTEQQKKNWLINWYFANDPMGSIYLATLRNPALVASYQTSPGMLYGANGAIGMETYFIKIKTHFGQSMFDQLVTEFAQQSNLYVDEIKVDEFHMYGSSRLGVYEANRLISKRVARDLNLDNQITTNEYVIETPEEVTYLFSSYQLERGAKRYELANHLGNVLTVISDKKTAICTGNTFNYFAAERISATDYSPFGAPLAGRSWQASEYRFGFGGQEKDDEVYSSGNSMSAEFWEYDSRLGRRWNVDPISYYWQSVYATFNNNPICFNDPLGLEGKDGGKDGKEKKEVGKFGSFLRDLWQHISHPSQHNRWGNTYYKQTKENKRSGWPSKVINWITGVFGSLHDKIPTGYWQESNNWIVLDEHIIENQYFYSLPFNLTNSRLSKTKIDVKFGAECKGFSHWNLFGDMGEIDMFMYSGSHNFLHSFFHINGVVESKSGIWDRMANILIGYCFGEVAISGFSYKTLSMQPFIIAGRAMNGKVNPMFINTTKFRIDMHSTVKTDIIFSVKVMQWIIVQPQNRGTIFKWFYGIND